MLCFCPSTEAASLRPWRCPMSRQKKLKKLQRRRERGLPARQWITEEPWEDRLPARFQLTECIITEEPLRIDPGKANFLRQVLGTERMERLHAMLSENPRAAIPQRTELLER